MSVLQAGQRVRSFQITEQIGRTAMSEVWLASDSAGQDVAIKTISSDFRSDDSLAERFQREAEEQRALRHASIVPIYDFFEEEGNLFLVMRYLPGGSLQELIERQGALGVREAIKISVQVLSALDFAHRNGLVHRDVKPSNILLDGECAYLSDFGIVLPIGRTRLTTGLVSMGTPEYMSPEQILNPPSVNHLTDVYSFGCVLYEMLSGAPPFQGNGESDNFSVQYKHAHEQPTPLRERKPEIPARLERIAMTALSKAPEDRFPGCGSFGKALEAVLDELSSAEAPKSPSSPLGLFNPLPEPTSYPRLSLPGNIMIAAISLIAPLAFIYTGHLQPVLLAGFLLSVIAQLRVLYKAWASIQGEQVRTTPSAAVARLIIPVFGTFWAIRAYPGFASRYNRVVKEEALRCPRQPVWFYWIFYVYEFWLAPVFTILDSRIAGYVYLTNALLFVPLSVGLLCSAVNRLAEARDFVTAMDPEHSTVQVLG